MLKLDFKETTFLNIKDLSLLLKCNNDKYIFINGNLDLFKIRLT